MIELIKNSKNVLTTNIKGFTYNSISPVSPLNYVPGLSFFYSIPKPINSFHIYSVQQQNDTVCLFTNKEYKSNVDLVNILKSRGLLFRNKGKAQKTLENISYYRLSGYLHHFYSKEKEDTFIDNVYFEDVVKLYGFDKKLRLLILDAIETIEIGLRSVIAKSLYNYKYAFNNRELFLNQQKFDDLKASRQKCWERSEALFAQKYKKEKILPPIWIEIETWSMGMIKDCINNLLPQYANSIIPSIGAIEHKKLKNWVSALVNIRNVSAHHGRLWNKDLFGLSVNNKAYPFHQHLQRINTTNQYRKFYHYCVVIWHIMQHIHPESTWNKRLYDLITTELPENVPYVGLLNMGFSEDWQDEIFWGLSDYIQSCNITTYHKDTV